MTRAGWVACQICGAEYRSQHAAEDCCADKKAGGDDDDHDSAVATDGGEMVLSPVAVNEHGCVIMTDGGQCADGTERLAKIDWRLAQRFQRQLSWLYRVTLNHRSRPHLWGHLDHSLSSWRRCAQSPLKNSRGRSIRTDTDDDPDVATDGGQCVDGADQLFPGEEWFLSPSLNKVKSSIPHLGQRPRFPIGCIFPSVSITTGNTFPQSGQTAGCWDSLSLSLITTTGESYINKPPCGVASTSLARSLYTETDDEPAVATDGGQYMGETDHDENARGRMPDSRWSPTWSEGKFIDLVVITDLRVRALLAEVCNDCGTTQESHFSALSSHFPTLGTLHTESTVCEVLTQSGGGSNRTGNPATDAELLTDGGHPVEDNVDVESALLETIRELDEGEGGAPIGEVVETVLEETGVRLDVLCDALRSTLAHGRAYRPEDTTLRRYAGDGGEDVEYYPDGFNSGGPLTDPPRNEPDPGDPSNWCYECGNQSVAHCGVCGMPLCHRHMETQAGFCSDRVTIETQVGDVAACIRPGLDDKDYDIAVDAPAFN